MDTDVGALADYMPGNRSGLAPCGHAILIKTYEPELRSSVIHIPDAISGRMTMVEQRCVVIEVGPEAWRDEGPWWKRLLGIRTLRAKPGERALVSKYAGHMVGGKDTKDGESYRLVNDRDLFCKITWE